MVHQVIGKVSVQRRHDFALGGLPGKARARSLARPRSNFRVLAALGEQRQVDGDADRDQIAEIGLTAAIGRTDGIIRPLVGTGEARLGIGSQGLGIKRAQAWQLRDRCLQTGRIDGQLRRVACNLRIGIAREARKRCARLGGFGDKIGAAVAKVLADPAVQERFTRLGVETSTLPQPEFQRLLAADWEKAGVLVKSSGAKVD